MCTIAALPVCIVFTREQLAESCSLCCKAHPAADSADAVRVCRKQVAALGVQLCSLDEPGTQVIPHQLPHLQAATAYTHAQQYTNMHM